MSDSKGRSRFTVLSGDRDTIYISESLFNKVMQNERQYQQYQQEQQQQQQQQQHEKPRQQQNTEREQAKQQEPSGYPSYSSEQVFGPVPPTKEPGSVPSFLDPEYIAKHAQFDSGTNLYALRGEYERKLQQYQQMWRARFEEIEHLNQQLFKLNSEKFGKEVSRVDERYFRNHAKYETPCKGLESSLQQCYQLNKKKPLLCSEEVKQFAQCIDKARIDVLKR